MKPETAILIITTTTLVGLVIVGIIGYRVYQRMAPTIEGLQGDYQGVGGLLNLITGKSPANN